MPMREQETAALGGVREARRQRAASWASGSEQLNTVSERSTKQRGRSGGGRPDRPVGCWKGLLRAGVLRSQHRLPSQLGNGMPLDLADALCGDSPDRADIGKLCLTAVNESIPAAYDVGRTLV